MDSRRPSPARVIMAKRVAAKWLEANARPEYRITVYAGSEDINNLPGLLRGFRDGQVRLARVSRIADLGIEVGLDQMTLWSANREAMLALDDWLTKRGCETTGIW